MSQRVGVGVGDRVAVAGGTLEVGTSVGCLQAIPGAKIMTNEQARKVTCLRSFLIRAADISQL